MFVGKHMSFVCIYIHKYEPYIACIFVDLRKIKKKREKKNQLGSWKIMESDWRRSDEREAVKKKGRRFALDGKKEEKYNK